MERRQCFDVIRFSAFLALIYCATQVSPQIIDDDPNGKIEAELLENDPTIFEGEELLMNCTLTHTRVGVDSRSLYLQFGNTPINESFYERPDNRTLLVRLHPPPEWNGGHVYCYAKDYVNEDGYLPTLAHQVVTILRKPLPPQLKSCQVANWASMKCTWTPTLAEQEIYTGMKITQQLVWILRKHPCQLNDECIYDLRNCELWETDNICVWPSSPYQNNNYYRRDQDYTMVVDVHFVHNSSGKNGTVNGTMTDVQTKYLVKPDPMINLREERVTGWNFTVTWGYTTFGHSLLHEVWVTQVSDPGIPPLKFQLRSYTRYRTSTFTLDNEKAGTVFVRPFTRYRVSIRTLPLFEMPRDEIPDSLCILPNTNYSSTNSPGHIYTEFENGDYATGYWSEFADLTLTTKTDVPGALPEVTSGLFRRYHYGQTWLAEVHWKHVPRAFTNGEPRFIHIHYMDTSASLSVPASSSSPRQRNDRDTTAQYDVNTAVVASGNSNGCDCPPESCLREPYSSTKTWVELREVLLRSRTYYVSVELENEVGCNATLRRQAARTPIVITQSDQEVAEPAFFVVRRYGQKAMWRLDWSPGDKSRMPDRYTIYWCASQSQNNFQNCLGELEWTYVSGNTTLYVFGGSEPGVMTLNRTQSYEFGLSAEELRASGFVSCGLQGAECTYDMHQSIKPPLDVHFAPAKEQVGKIKLLWQNPQPCKETAYIGHYEIVYWPDDPSIKRVSDPQPGDSQSEPDSSHISSNRTRIVEASRTSFEIENVTAGMYHVLMRSVSPWNASQHVRPKPPTVVVVSPILSSKVTVILVVVALTCLVPAICGIVSLVKYCRRKLKPRELAITVPSTFDPGTNSMTMKDMFLGACEPHATTISEDNSEEDEEEEEHSKPFLNGNCNGSTTRFANGSYHTFAGDSAMDDSVKSSPETGGDTTSPLRTYSLRETRGEQEVGGGDAARRANLAPSLSDGGRVPLSVSAIGAGLGVGGSAQTSGAKSISSVGSETPLLGPSSNVASGASLPPHTQTHTPAHRKAVASSSASSSIAPYTWLVEQPEDGKVVQKGAKPNALQPNGGPAFKGSLGRVQTRTGDSSDNTVHLPKPAPFKMTNTGYVEVPSTVVSQAPDTPPQQIKNTAFQASGMHNGNITSQPSKTPIPQIGYTTTDQFNQGRYISQSNPTSTTSVNNARDVNLLNDDTKHSTIVTDAPSADTKLTTTSISQANESPQNGGENVNSDQNVASEKGGNSLENSPSITSPHPTDTRNLPVNHSHNIPSVVKAPVLNNVPVTGAYTSFPPQTSSVVDDSHVSREPNTRINT